MKRKMNLKPIRLMGSTPIEEHSGFTGSTRLFIKRDDLNGVLVSGNKTRKLEYLAADARRLRCDTLVTCGPVQSNHCRTTAAFARSNGLKCHLFLRKKDHEEMTGNLLLDKLLGATITYITPAQYERRLDLMAAYARRMRKRGSKCYVIPEGGSNETGSLGYINCMKEMAGFIKANNIDAVYCAVGSGGTYAGLLLGKKLLGLRVALYGVIICDTVRFFEDKILTICKLADDRFGLNARVRRSDIQLVGGFVGKGYGIPYSEEIKVIKELAKTGIILEPVYTGKAFYGMRQHLKKNRCKKAIFVHTGGIFSIFAFGKELG
ncbi:MAG TPA: D-cysteine desulfhydrase family protein [bacterium]